MDTTFSEKFKENSASKRQSKSAFNDKLSEAEKGKKTTAFPQPFRRYCISSSFKKKETFPLKDFVDIYPMKQQQELWKLVDN